MKGHVLFRDIYCKLFHKEIAEGLSLRNRKFQEFKNKHFKFSRNYLGWKDLKKTNNEYDIFIIGSDQVWNPINIGTDFFNLLLLMKENFEFLMHQVLEFQVFPIVRLKKRKNI